MGDKKKVKRSKKRYFYGKRCMEKSDVSFEITHTILINKILIGLVTINQAGLALDPILALS